MNFLLRNLKVIDGLTALQNSTVQTRNLKTIQNRKVFISPDLHFPVYTFCYIRHPVCMILRSVGHQRLDERGLFNNRAMKPRAIRKKYTHIIRDSIILCKGLDNRVGSVTRWRSSTCIKCFIKQKLFLSNSLLQKG